MKIETKKIGGIWHGYLEGHPEIDERGLTEEVALRKAERQLELLRNQSRSRDMSALDSGENEA